MSNNNENKNGLEHLLKSSGARPFIPKTNKYDSDLFSAKFAPSLLKVLQLKGIELKIIEESSQVIHAPQIDELAQGILLKPFVNSQKKLGLIAFSSDFVSEMIHKMMGGSDKVLPGALTYPLSPIQQRVIDSFDPALANSLREGIKVFLGLDIIKVKKQLNEVESQALLQESGDYFVTHYKFQGLTTSSLMTMLKVEAFNA